MNFYWLSATFWQEISKGKQESPPGLRERWPLVFQLHRAREIRLGDKSTAVGTALRRAMRHVRSLRLANEVRPTQTMAHGSKVASKSRRGRRQCNQPNRLKTSPTKRISQLIQQFATTRPTIARFRIFLNAAAISMVQPTHKIKCCTHLKVEFPIFRDPPCVTSVSNRGGATRVIKPKLG